MSERQKQSEFIKSMLHLDGNTQELEDWQARIHKAEKEERCVGSSLRLVSLIFLLSVCGLGYCRLFLNGSMTHSPQLFIKIFFALTVASTLCIGVFGCIWLYYCHLTNRLCAEGRQYLISLAQSRSTIVLDSQSRPSSDRSSGASEEGNSYPEGLAKAA